MSDPFISEIMDAADSEISAMRRKIDKLSGALSLTTSERDDLAILNSSLNREKVIAKEINDALVEKNHNLQKQLEELTSLMMADRLTKASPWISIKDDLPPYEKPVWISVKGEVKQSAYMLCGTEGCDDWFEECNGIGPDFTDIDDVDAWMSIPEVPEVQK